MIHRTGKVESINDSKKSRNEAFAIGFLRPSSKFDSDLIKPMSKMSFDLKPSRAATASIIDRVSEVREPMMMMEKSYLVSL